ncbi:RND family transporter [Pseudomonas sp. NPDC090755]|uniref:efflux RND transporter permease subunit n=1 Tax=Pseudomonas sp. NPDC090755 TaxID=3364481 RepID=UPI00383A5934
MPVVRTLNDFDSGSGNWLERLIFNNRALVIVLCTLVTLLLAAAASRLVLNASFEKTIPQSQPYIKHYLEHRNELRGLGNAIRVVVENPTGDIFDPKYLETLKRINDELFLTPGVDRAWVKSLWTPSVRWNEVTEDGFAGGPVMPDQYSASPADIAALRQNISRAQLLGNLVAGDYASSMIVVPLFDRDPATGQALDYWQLARNLEHIRDKYATAQDDQTTAVKLHITGFAKVMGELLDGIVKVMGYFLVAALIAALLIFLYTRCLRSTFLVLLCSTVAVVWQLGLIQLLGYELDPYSILVPFLVFAIGVSHAAQKMNGIILDIARGTHPLVAARYTFRRLFLAGLTALLADAVGFAVLVFIDIPVIKDLAITASIGVAVLVFTNLILLPVMLSWFGVSRSAAARVLASDPDRLRGIEHIWPMLARFTERKWASITIAVWFALAAAGFALSLKLQIGDLDPGAPELRKDARYNQDNLYITRHYALSSDQFAIIVKTPADGCLDYQTVIETDRLSQTLQNVPGVQATTAYTDAYRRITAGSFDGNPKWLTLSPDQQILNYDARTVASNNPELINEDCSVAPVVAYLTDHKAQTLDRVVAAGEAFAAAHNSEDRQFLLAAGSAGIEAATNIVVREANRSMLLFVYAAVIVLCYVAFRSWRAVLVAVIPLVITSILCEALMVVLGMGVKVATLPVIALGVGIGVDYALYLLSVQLARQRAGEPLRHAYRHAVDFTGRVVALVGLTLAAGVVTWAWSPIKFQADMGILLTFMFVLNMVGALVLIPALSHFLLPDPARAGANLTHSQAKNSRREQSAALMEHA